MVGALRRRFSALTLSEVVLALGVLAIAGLAVVGVFIKLMGAQSKSSHATVSRFILESVAERATLAGPPNWGMNNISVPQTENVFIHSQNKAVTFTYSITPLAMKAAPTSNPMGSLHYLEIEVSWWGNEARVGSGKTNVKTSRVVYVEE